MRGYNIENYIGMKFNHLTLLKDLKKLDNHNSKLALFKCDCGNLKEIAFTTVFNGNIKSCGCIQGNMPLTAKAKQQKSLLHTYSNKTIKSNTSGYCGISIVNGKYRVRIQLNKKSKHIGYFFTLEEAIQARKKAEKEYFRPVLDKYSTKRLRLSSKPFSILRYVSYYLQLNLLNILNINGTGNSFAFTNNDTVAFYLYYIIFFIIADKWLIIILYSL